MWTDALRQGKDGVFIDLDVNPASKRLGISGYEPWRKRITLDLKAKPQEGEANAELVKYLARLLELPPDRIIISSGHTSGHKRVLVKGLDMGALKERLRDSFGPE